MLTGQQATHMDTHSTLKHLSAEMGWTCSERWIKAYRKWEKSEVRMDMDNAPCKEEKDGILGTYPYSNPDERVTSQQALELSSQS